MAEAGITNREKRRVMWLAFVRRTIEVLESGRSIPLGPFKEPLAAPQISLPSDEPARIMIAAPHPGDECRRGALALRLRRESGTRVVNRVVTLGSKVEQRPRRPEELRSASRVLDFDLIGIEKSGLERATLENRRERLEEWRAKVDALRQTFDREKPDAAVGAARLPFGMGRDNGLPKRLFAHLDPNSRTPTFKILLIGGLSFGGSFGKRFDLIAELLNFGAFLGFKGVSAATIRQFCFLPQKG